MNDEICVIVAAMNAERTVARAVASALREEAVREVVVVDDASEDATAHEAWGADDGSGRLKVLRAQKNLGPAAARNLAIARSRAPRIAILDADDVILPGRFAALADAAGDWDMSADNMMFVSEEQAEAYTHLAAFATGGIAERMSFARFVAANISQAGRPRGELGFLKPVMRRAFLDRHGLRYDPSLRLGEDFDLYARMLLAGARFRLVAACGYLAIERADSLSARHAAADLAALVEADDRMLAGHLSPDEREVLLQHRTQCAQRWHHRHFLDAKQKSGLVRALYENRDRPRLLLDAGLGVARDKLALLRPARLPGKSDAAGEPRFLIAPSPVP
ncbi:glycosyltransferase family 2 protein [Erythrobacter sp. NE805]|uniref:glycosyltransferase family 2 protein n=1 Tax=Erythrobacter sp. NE805 TaxID=3389875 RepID=UPI00396B451E